MVVRDKDEKSLSFEKLCPHVLGEVGNGRHVQTGTLCADHRSPSQHAFVTHTHVVVSMPRRSVTVPDPLQFIFAKPTRM